jgi:hypothetical protein
MLCSASLTVIAVGNVLLKDSSSCAAYSSGQLLLICILMLGTTKAPRYFKFGRLVSMLL